MSEHTPIEILAKIVQLQGRRAVLQARYEVAWREKAFWDNATQMGQHRRDHHQLYWNSDGLAKETTKRERERGEIAEQLMQIDEELSQWNELLAGKVNIPADIKALSDAVSGS